MKKALIIIGGIVLVIVIAFIVVFSNSKKLVCKSKEGNITLMYNSKGITGYTASNMTYDLDGQQEVAKQIGVDAYLEEFTEWFSNNTTGTCTK